MVVLSLQGPFIKNLFIFFLVCVCTLVCTYEWALLVSCALEEQEGASDLLELELQGVVICHVGVGN